MASNLSYDLLIGRDGDMKATIIAALRFAAGVHRDRRVGST